jgi:hypothetical protein
MNREDVIRWMQEVGAKESNPTPQTYDGFVVLFQQFAKLAAEWGAKQEREACAKVCDEVIRDLYIVDGDASEEVLRCANAIRARGEVPK